ncbi:hypothetical protein Ddye_027968 [Dipteronia dyeriana]|uniref:Transmembrane protein n=1 Tax=Dipteronia dyeriana TaxID=168575 RepID=A0AAD9WRY3_9ROSI|nr:hypothetical protein Ddye_027968 [Dipteronia dyeriana]
MEIPETIVRFKFHIIFSLIFSLLLLSIFLIAPSFLTILAYFWPLFLSTALFLVAVVLFGKTSPPAAAAGDKAGEGLLDYVAGQPQEEVGHVESFKLE